MSAPGGRSTDLRLIVSLYEEFVVRRLALASMELVELSLIRLCLAVEEYQVPRRASPAARDYCVAALNYAVRIAKNSYRDYLTEMETGGDERRVL